MNAKPGIGSIIFHGVFVDLCNASRQTLLENLLDNLVDLAEQVSNLRLELRRQSVLALKLPDNFSRLVCRAGNRGFGVCPTSSFLNASEEF
jgi:hypothetical protein